MADTSIVVMNPWRRLKTFTDARIGLGRAGVSLPTRELLEFELAHARARDAVHLPLDCHNLAQTIQACTWCPAMAPQLLVSQAEDRMQYLQRPDFGRRLNDRSRDHLIASQAQPVPEHDLAIVIVDGLSALAVTNNTVPLLDALLPLLGEIKLAPVCIVEQGRVAIGDEVGALLNARCVLVLIGERPGLSSPDSLGVYLTFKPQVGCSDAQRNCISNVRPAGLSYAEAARRCHYLYKEANRQQLSGVKLKDRTEDDVIESTSSRKNFLTQSEDE